MTRFPEYITKILAFTLTCLVTTAIALEVAQPNRILFTNVNIFDGVSETLDMNSNVLVEDNLIASVGISITAPEGTEVIDGGCRTLMPGLIEGHGHLQMNRTSLADIENNRNWEELAVRSVAKAEMALMSEISPHPM